MTGVQETSCMLCLKTVTVNGFEVIDDVTRDTLDVLLLKLKFDSNGKEVICNVCRRELNAAFEFKSTCLNTDYTIIPHVDCEKMLQLDIRDAYMKEKTSESMDISDGQRICRLCMDPVEGEFRCIREEELEAIEKLAPEMNINIIKDPVVCKECFDSVCTHNTFLKNCSQVQEKVIGIFNSAATEGQIDTSPSDLFVKTEDQDKEFDISEMEMSIKAESIDIKSEDEESRYSPLQSSDSESFVKSVLRDAEEDGCKHENRLTNECNTNVKQDHKVFYKCNKCIYETGSESRFIAHRARHENDSEAYKCESCEYETENKKFFQKPRLRQKNPSEMCMHRCGSYDYKTRHRYELAKSQVQTYKCNDCGYKTIYKIYLKSHELKHKDPSQVQMYRCKECDYKTINKKYLKRHQLKHKDPQVQTYKYSGIFTLKDQLGGVADGV
ncbi:hunchback-like protein [Anoplophora glabripennis]|uniref:hunchback-like protein n=1 Tax=Anoplophora glabripennis TaxID=217634 RepID=UPI000C75DE31|nr:hunchback-like protein [Anoplophora glabripennis]